MWLPGRAPLVPQTSRSGRSAGRAQLLEVPILGVIYTRTVVDPSQLALPDNWAEKLAAAFKNLPAPQITNVVELQEEPDPPKTVTFDRDGQGRISQPQSRTPP
jgi:hypothetical protein